ncbi:MAG TPA: GntG family PLP-dependent aldolase [Spirochaetota bacterium]|nr:GntG family PLP-dependent aldolase [Spirochaetota bacterium]HPF05744.1 GntG family PLP-dependent aldolase [Spirochaetota bacterium]
MIDLRSDTVTKPGKKMLEEMMKAEVGDDVFMEDPTINRLEKMGSELFGMEAALFCASGTMTNQIAINVHTKPGDEVICDKLSHIYFYEGGGIAKNSSASVALLPGDRGRFTADDVKAAICPDDIHRPVTSLVAVENTVNKGGGSYWNYHELQKISVLCREKNIAFHMDGARFFNAITETGETPDKYGRLFDSISICLSKGLGAPVGSLLLGSNDFIKRARRVRKVFGGGMRQAGFLAAAGIYALENNIKRLGEDHRRAREIGKVLNTLPYVEEVIPVETNILIFKVSMDEKDFLLKLKDRGILATAFGPKTIRFVTHLDFSEEMLNKTEAILREIK